MSGFFQSRRLIALAAAYVVALQALLLPLSVAAGGPFDTSLCAAASSIEHSQTPASHGGGCPCAAGCGMQCCTQTLAASRQTTVAFDLTPGVAMAPPPTIAPVIRSAVRSPLVPRAPPAA